MGGADRHKHTWALSLDGRVHVACAGLQSHNRSHIHINRYHPAAGDVTIDISSHEKNSSSSKKETGTVSKSSQVLVRKREEIEKSVRINEEKAQEVKPDTWYKHWEKGENPGDAPVTGNAPKRLGGNKRVKPFKYEDQKDEDDSQ